jgi:thiol-disulfide isomerase/thioredoxin
MMRAFLFVLALFGFAAHARAQEPAPPQQAPKVTVTAQRAPAPSVKLEPAKVISDELFARDQREIGGRVFRLADYRGRVFVVNIWATWCGPCWREIPEFNRVHADYSARGVEFIGLVMNDPTNDADKVNSVARELKMKYKLAWLDYQTATALMGTRTVIPQTFVVGTDGRVLLHVRGYNPAVPDMVRAAVGRALNPPAAAPAAPATAPPRP